VKIDDELVTDRWRGRPPLLSDSELVCLAVAQALLQGHNEARRLRFIGRRLGGLFPYPRGAPGHNKRLRAALTAFSQRPGETSMPLCRTHAEGNVEIGRVASWIRRAAMAGNRQERQQPPVDLTKRYEADSSDPKCRYAGVARPPA